MKSKTNTPPNTETIGEYLETGGVSRREFLAFCGKLAVVAPVGLKLTQGLMPSAIAEEISKSVRPPVIWLHFQDCTGCSETLLRTSAPDVAQLILDLVSLEYHETLMVAAGHQAEANLENAVTQYNGRFVLVVEGSIPTRDKGIYATIAGRPALEILEHVGSRAAAIVAIGSCASWGGVPSSYPNPTGAVGVDSIIENKPIINIPGCPPNPYTFLGTVLEFARYGTIPELDDKKRPKFAFDQLIHDHCPRRGHFDAGEFALEFGDEGHRNGWCLYKLGCKGPVTHAACSLRHFNEVVDAWPIGIGAPCYGCTEKGIVFEKPLFELAQVHKITPPAHFPTISGKEGEINPLATGLVGLATGAVTGAAFVASRYFSNRPGDESSPGAVVDKENSSKKKGDGDR